VNNDGTPFFMDNLKTQSMAYFSNLFSFQHINYIYSILDVIPKVITIEDNYMLCAISNEMENFQCLKSMKVDGAPDLDGFTLGFFYAHWNIINKGVCRAINLSFKGHMLPHTWKATFISLIPKINNLSTSKDFRPISLCNASYKIIAKILALRLDFVLVKFISMEQGAIVKG
jgi:hypothetical protein